MGKFLLRFFAVIGFVFTLIIAGIWYVGAQFASRPVAMPKAPESMVLTLDLSRPILDKEEVSPLSALLRMEEEATTSFAVVRAIEKAKDDPRVKGLIAKFGSEQPSMVHAQEIREAVLAFKQSGKPTYAFAPSYGEFGFGNRAYYLASAFNEIWLQPVGAVGITGIAMEAPFGKSALGSIGVSGDFMQREEYKSAMESFTRDDFSPAAKANVVDMINNLQGQIAQGIAVNRNWKLDEVKGLIERGPYTATEAVQNNLVTKLGYEDEFLREAEEKTGKDAKRVDEEAYLVFANVNVEPKATVALIEGEGLITDSNGHHLADDSIMDANTVAEAFFDAAEDKDVKAIIFRVNSPGGSPVASETIRHALIMAKKSKPVFVSMGEVAASGGYWVAMDADHIVASPATITGSIGVVSGKFVTSEMWKKLGIKWDGVYTSGNAQMWSMLSNFDEKGRARVNALMDETYQAFLAGVSTARKIPQEKLPDIAKGRVWTGEQALKLGLVDELGGMSTATLAVKNRLNLAASDAIELKPFPAEPTPAEVMMKFLKNFGTEGEALGNLFEETRAIRSALVPLVSALSNNEPVSARAPDAIIRAVK